MVLENNLQEKIKEFKQEVINKQPFESDKNFIYLRLSRLDNTIKDKNKQIEDAISKLRADYKSLLNLYPNLEKEGFKLFVEVKSAYKNLLM